MSKDGRQFERQNTPKPCKFCNNGATFSPLEEMERHGVHVYFCHTCKAEYLYYWDGALASVSIYTEIGAKMYRWTTSHDEVTGTLSYVKNPGVPGSRRNTNLEHLKYFDTRKGDVVHSLTPANVNEKIKTWLLFL